MEKITSLSAHIFFRVDATPLTGAGHFSRCLCIADKLIQMNAVVYFLCRKLPVFYADILKNHHINYIALESKDTNESPPNEQTLVHSHWLEVSQQQDALDTINAIRLNVKVADCLIIDHYALDVHFEQMIKNYTKKIVVIDDLADRKHDCHILIDQNNTDEKRYEKKIPSTCKQLLGSSFCILRDEFIEAKKNFSYNFENAKDILIFMGGADAANVTFDVVQSLSKADYMRCHLKVIIGALNPHAEQIKWLCDKKHIPLFIHVENIAEHLKTTKLVIGASGISAWERCFLGIPSCIITIADNQIPIAHILEEKESTVYMGKHTEINWEVFNKKIQSLYYNTALLSQLSKNAQSLVDGLGVLRMAQHLV